MKSCICSHQKASCDCGCLCDNHDDRRELGHSEPFIATGDLAQLTPVRFQRRFHSKVEAMLRYSIQEAIRAVELRPCTINSHKVADEAIRRFAAKLGRS